MISTVVLTAYLSGYAVTAARAYNKARQHPLIGRDWAWYVFVAAIIWPYYTVIDLLTPAAVDRWHAWLRRLR